MAFWLICDLRDAYFAFLAAGDSTAYEAYSDEPATKQPHSSCIGCMITRVLLKSYSASASIKQ